MENIDKAIIKDNLNSKPDNKILEILQEGVMIFYAVWYSYLNMSKWVKATFPSKTAEIRINQKLEEL